MRNERYDHLHKEKESRDPTVARHFLPDFCIPSCDGALAENENAAALDKTGHHHAAVEERDELDDQLEGDEADEDDNLQEVHELYHPRDRHSFLRHSQVLLSD